MKPNQIAVRNPFHLLSMLLILISITSCMVDDEGGEGRISTVNEFGAGQFTDNDLKSFEGVLNLEKKLFN